MRRLTRTILVAGLLAASACAAGPTPTPTAQASRERSVEMDGVTLAATPERIDTTGAVVRLKLDTHTTPLDINLPGAAHLSVGGKDWPARGWNGPGPGGHHREGTLEFSPGGPANGSVRLALDGLAAEHDCPCGRPYALLAGIQGRAQAALRFPTGDGGGRVVQPIVFHHVMDHFTTAAWQIIQRPDGLEVLLVQPHEVDQPVLVAGLQAALTAQGVVAPTMRIREVAAIPRTALGKAPLITNADT